MTVRERVAQAVAAGQLPALALTILDQRPDIAGREFVAGSASLVDGRLTFTCRETTVKEWEIAVEDGRIDAQRTE